MVLGTICCKLNEVLSKISGKELKSFVMVYASSHDDFATALVEKYWKPERGNYKDMVEACFAHAGVSRRRIGGPSLDWRKIEKDLQPVMRKAVTMRKKGNLIDAALIAGYVMITTCRGVRLTIRTIRLLGMTCGQRRIRC